MQSAQNQINDSKPLPGRQAEALSRLQKLFESNKHKGPFPLGTPSPLPKESQRQLSLWGKWGDEERGIPNAILRGALFGAIAKGKRAFLERQEIHAQEGIHMFYTGSRLDQGDLDVMETLWHIARVQILGGKCRVSAYQLLGLLRKSDSGKNRETLDRRLSRLSATSLDVRVGAHSYEGSLIDEVCRTEYGSKYVIRLNPQIATLFADGQFTRIDWNVRRALDGKPLAQWLHGYYSSHAKPYPVKPSTLLAWSGSANENSRSGRQTLRKALDALMRAYSKCNLQFGYEIIDDLVHVRKEPSRAQRKHLEKMKSK